MIVYDQSNEFSVTLNVGSDDHNALMAYVENTSFLIELTYPGDHKAEPRNLESSQENIPDNLVKLYFDVKAMNLDPNANGFGLITSFDEDYAANARLLNWGYDINHDSPNRWMYWGRVDWAYTNNQNSDVLVRWYYRTCQYCSMTYDSNAIGNSLSPIDIYNKDGVRRIRARVFSNWRNYNVYFKKWENDAWR